MGKYILPDCDKQLDTDFGMVPLLNIRANRKGLLHTSIYYCEEDNNYWVVTLGELMLEADTSDDVIAYINEFKLCDNCDMPFKELQTWNDSEICEGCTNDLLDDQNAGVHKFGYDTLMEKNL